MKAIKTASDSESLWTKAPVANLVRYEPSGVYFARAKVHGKLVRKSLDTNVLSIAKLRLADVLETEHKAIGATKTKIMGKMTFGDALALFQEQQKTSTEIKERSKEYNQRCAEALLRTWNGLEDLDVKRITNQEFLRWRAEFGNRYSATVVNGTLSILRRVFDIAVDTGALRQSGQNEGGEKGACPAQGTVAPGTRSVLDTRQRSKGIRQRVESRVRRRHRILCVRGATPERSGSHLRAGLQFLEE